MSQFTYEGIISYPIVFQHWNVPTGVTPPNRFGQLTFVIPPKAADDDGVFIPWTVITDILDPLPRIEKFPIV